MTPTFGHANIIQLCGRPFKDVHHMNTVIVDRWNETVEPEDVVYHLGDAVMGLFAENINIIRRLNGYKILVPGNHDKIWSDNKPSYIDKFRDAYLDVFQEVWPEQAVSRDGLRISHLPFHGDSHHDDRYADMRPVPEFPGQWLVNGHVHEKWKVKDNQINVGVDVWDFRPVSSEQIFDIMRDATFNKRK